MTHTAKPFQKPVLEILEESLHLLRRMGVDSLCIYAIGVLPFVLGLMYFWADMSQSPFADAHLLPASLGLASLFVWMKCWQAAFMRRMLAKACGDQPPRYNARQIGQMIVTQSIIQPAGLIILPLATLFALPLPFALAIFNTAALLGDGQENLTTRQVIRQSWQLGMLWPGQSMSAILLIMPVILTITLLNVVQAIVIPPYMIKLLLGVDTFFTQVDFSIFNTTFLVITLGITYLCVDPLVKAFYTLRCFHGRSIQTGQDLHAEIKSIAARRAAQALGVVVLLVAMLLPASPAGAQTPPPAKPPAASPGAVNPDQLDNSIRKVINRRQYAWRMPRDKSQMRGFLDSLSDKLKAWQDENRRKQQEAEKARKDETPPPDRNSGSGGSSGGSVDAGSLRAIIYILIVLAAGGLIGLLVFAWRNRQPKEEKPDEEEAETATPDLTDDDISADNLPEEGWLDLARQMLAQGDRRLALRALYLASLALLSERQIISIAKFKSNREYELEVRRRGHALPEVTTAFGQNVTFFEDAWYGMHEVTEKIVNNFAFNQERIRSVAGARGSVAGILPARVADVSSAKTSENGTPSTQRRADGTSATRYSGHATLKVLTALAVVAFIYGVIQLFVLRFDAGDIYPPYSTLRADPIGAKAFYEALSEMPGMNVDRNYFPMRQLKRFADTPDTTLFFLGCDASTGIEDRKLSEIYRQENQTWDDLLKFVSGGGRLVLTFSPTDSPAADAVLKARLGASVNGRSLAGMNTATGPRAIRDGAEPSDASSVSWHATTYFDELSPEWATLYSVEGKPVIIERKFEKGSVVLAADSYFISNEAMLNEPHADLLSQIVGAGRKVVFDETHLGVQQEAGIASLVRQYNLAWLGAAMLILTALFIWRNAASFIPRSEAGGENLTGASVAGRSSVSGLVHLISRAVPLKDLISTCVTEFLRNRSAMSKDTRENITALAEAERQARKRIRDTVGTYRRIVSILQERK